MAQSVFGGLDKVFWARRPLVGMVHLAALPGSPGYAEESMDSILARAAAEARALEEGGANALMIENFFDVPFARDSVPPHTIAAMTSAVLSVRKVTALPLGVNVLRNDACAGLAIAHICGAQFVRVNVWVGAAVTDQGIIEGAARSAILYRKELGADVAIWADVFVKHAAQLGVGTLEDAAKDAVHRGRADALIVSGAATGADTAPGDVRRVKAAVPETPVLVGSGFSLKSARSLLEHANGAIVGTSLKQDGQVEKPIEASRVRALRTAMEAVNHPLR